MQQKSNQTLLRSNIHQKLYPDDLVLDAFGKLNPSISERTAYFFDCWVDNRPNRYMIKEIISSQRKPIIAEMNMLLDKIGLTPMWDYQIKGSEIRFARASDLAMFKLSWNHDR